MGLYFLCLNSQKYSPSDVLSEYIYISRVMFDILIDIPTTVHHSKKKLKLFFIFSYTNAAKCIKMVYNGNQEMPMALLIPNTYTFSYLY